MTTKANKQFAPKYPEKRLSFGSSLLKNLVSKDLLVQDRSECLLDVVFVAIDSVLPWATISPEILMHHSVLLFPRLTPIFAPAGLAYSNLVYDWVKAAVMFGVINTIARLDHLDPPQPPKCITMLYIFAET